MSDPSFTPRPTFNIYWIPPLPRPTQTQVCCNCPLPILRHQSPPLHQSLPLALPLRRRRRKKRGKKEEEITPSTHISLAIIASFCHPFSKTHKRTPILAISNSSLSIPLKSTAERLWPLSCNQVLPAPLLKYIQNLATSYSIIQV